MRALVAKRRPVADAKPEQPTKKYFVAPRETLSRTVSQNNATPKEPAGGATKYFTRRVVLASELDEVWRGTGPDLPPGYEGAEGCPDCSAFKYTPHARSCIRHPRSPWHATGQWDELHTKQQIYFGVGHPVVADVDSYMTMDRQRVIARAAMVVRYDKGVLSAGETIEH